MTLDYIEFENVSKLWGTLASHRNIRQNEHCGPDTISAAASVPISILRLQFAHYYTEKKNL
jgi:hypothetical protein